MSVLLQFANVQMRRKITNYTKTWNVHQDTQNVHKKYRTCICSLDCRCSEMKAQFHCLFPSFSRYTLELIEFLLDGASEVCGRGVCSQERWRFTGGGGGGGEERRAERRRYDGGKSWLRRGTQKIVSHSISLSRSTISFHPQLFFYSACSHYFTYPSALAIPILRQTQGKLKRTNEFWEGEKDIYALCPILISCSIPSTLNSIPLLANWKILLKKELISFHVMFNISFLIKIYLFPSFYFLEKKIPTYKRFRS